MQNYRKCISDCREAIKLDATIEKPWFRAAKALLALDKVAEARDCIDNALAIKPENRQIADLKDKVEKRAAHLERQITLRREREEREKRGEQALKIALRARDISTRATKTPPEMPDGIKIAFEVDGDPNTHLLFPVMLIYHLHMQTDMVAGMHETTTFGDQLAEVLGAPLPWDEKREYTPAAKVDCYMETKTGGLVKVGKKVSLLEALGGEKSKVEVVDGLVKVLVVPRARTAEFVENWKKTMRKN